VSTGWAEAKYRVLRFAELLSAEFAETDKQRQGEQRVPFWNDNKKSKGGTSKSKTKTEAKADPPPAAKDDNKKAKADPPPTAKDDN
jgi:hypothetical protein